MPFFAACFNVNRLTYIFYVTCLACLSYLGSISANN